MKLILYVAIYQNIFNAVIFCGLVNASDNGPHIIRELAHFSQTIHVVPLQVCHFVSVVSGEATEVELEIFLDFLLHVLFGRELEFSAKQVDEKPNLVVEQEQWNDDGRNSYDGHGWTIPMEQVAIQRDYSIVLHANTAFWRKERECVLIACNKTHVS